MCRQMCVICSRHSTEESLHLFSPDSGFLRHFICASSDPGDEHTDTAAEVSCDFNWNRDYRTNRRFYTDCDNEQNPVQGRKTCSSVLRLTARSFYSEAQPQFGPVEEPDSNSLSLFFWVSSWTEKNTSSSLRSNKNLTRVWTNKNKTDTLQTLPGESREQERLFCQHDKDEHLTNSSSPPVFRSHLKRWISKPDYSDLRLRQVDLLLLNLLLWDHLTGRRVHVSLCRTRTKMFHWVSPASSK